MRMSTKRIPRRLTALVGATALVASGLVANATLMVAAPAPALAVSPPESPTDQSSVPHYFGPYPNWANSPFTLSTAAVDIAGTGQGAEAVAQVDRPPAGSRRST